MIEPSVEVPPLPVIVIGAGPAGLFAAEYLAQAGHKVHVYDGMASVGRKFLLAGRGGLNLTHSEALVQFKPRYELGLKISASPYLSGPAGAYSPEASRHHPFCAHGF
eukprot:gene4442-5665_t